MNEININIEGYNVNGICVGCLNYNRKMFYADEVKECFRILGNIDVPDGLTIQVCWECLAAVKAVRRFQLQITRSYMVLMDYSGQHTFLDSPEDLAAHASTRLCVEHVHATSSVPPCGGDGDGDGEAGGGPDGDHKPPIDDIKVEIEMGEQYAMAAKAESEDELSAEEESAGPPDPPQPQDSSDEEVRLSKLKRRKERKVRKTRDKTKNRKERPAPTVRKLKNLPEDAVELMTLDEDEMWSVRADDLRSEEFLGLKYKCTDCIMAFTSDKLMKYHLKSKHKPKQPSSHQCDVCRAYFLTGDNVSAHRAQHLAAYRCLRCDFRTTLKRAIVRHLPLHEAIEPVDGGACEKCGLTFATRYKLSYHRVVCRQEKPQCDCCGKVFANKVTLKHHIKSTLDKKPETSSKESKEPKEPQNIQCKGCDKVFLSRKSYRAHVVIHDGLEYPCPVCGKLFQWKRNLARHLRNHADREAGARHECRQCGKRFSSRDCYNNHMRFSKRHVSEDMFVHGCEFCGKKFATKWCLVDHVDWEHHKKIKYQCSVCLKAFKTAKIMVAHMNNIHEGKKKSEPESEHLCDICGKSYKTVKRLKGHVWAMHTHRSTSKSFKCKLCPAVFTWQTSIYKHVKMMHYNKRGNKQPRPQQPKPEPYSGLELNNRMYFQQNLVTNVQGLVAPTGLVQNMV